MENSKRCSVHTPGPWTFTGAAEARAKDGINLNQICFGDKSRNRVCTVAGHGVSKEENDANARLIAAAPELLEALEGVLRVADRKTVEFDAARAAIAKARGEAAGAVAA